MSLARTVVRGVVWTSLTSLLVRAFTIVGNILLLGLISSDDMGVVNASQTLVLSAAAVGTLGVGPYLIIHRDAGVEDNFHAFVMHFAMGLLVIAAVLIPGAHWGQWFGAPGLEKFAIGLCIAMVADRIAHIPERLLVRKLQFVLTSNIRLAGEIVFSVVSVAFAYSGSGPVCLVYGSIARSILKMILTVTRLPLSEWLVFVPLRWAVFRRIGSFGLRIWPQTFSVVAVSKWDNFIVSSYYGPGVLGNYNQAYNFADMPVSQVSEQMTDLLMPSFSTLAPERRPDGVLRALGLNSMVMMPIGFGLAAVAESLIHSMPVKEDWYAMIPMLSILALLSVFRPMSGVLSAYLNAQGRPGTTVLLELFALAWLLIAGVTLGSISPLWLCAASMSAFGARAIVNMYVVSRLDQRPMTRYLGRVVPILAACSVMVGAVLGVRYGLRAIGVTRPQISLAAEVVVGAATYVGACFVVARGHARDFIATLKQARKRKSS